MTNRFSARAIARHIFNPDDDEGQALVEYSLILVLVVIVCFSIVTIMSETINDRFFQIVRTLP